MRVEPPTRTTSSICSGFTPASFIARLQGPAVRSMIGRMSSSNCSRVISRWYLCPPGRVTLMAAAGLDESAILASMTAWRINCTASP